MTYRVPKQIASHPGVESCESASETTMGEYRHEVVLRDGWAWTFGRNAGGQTLFINSVADFLVALPALSAIHAATGEK
jgi:hypothetical protein